MPKTSSRLLEANTPSPTKDGGIGERGKEGNGDWARPLTLTHWHPIHPIPSHPILSWLAARRPATFVRLHRGVYKYNKRGEERDALRRAYKIRNAPLGLPDPSHRHPNPTPVAVGGGKSATWQRGRDDKAGLQGRGEGRGAPMIAAKPGRAIPRGRIRR